MVMKYKIHHQNGLYLNFNSVMSEGMIKYHILIKNLNTQHLSILLPCIWCEFPCASLDIYRKLQKCFPYLRAELLVLGSEETFKKENRIFT